MANLLAESYLHRLDPFAIEFPAGWPGEGIRWYGLAYLAGFAAAWWLIKLLSKRGRSPIPAGSVADLMIYAVLGVLVGGRLGYCLFYDQSLLVRFESKFPWWGLLAIHQGGMASHGGILGALIACWIFAKRHGLSRLHLLDVGVFVCPPGLFLGRLANFVNGELRGEPLPAAGQANPPWWSVKYPDELTDPAFDPGRLDAVRDQLASTLGLPPRVSAEEVLSVTQRAVADGRQEVIDLVQPLLTAHYPSQLFQAVTDGPVLMAALAFIWLRPRKPGVVGAWFLIVYGVLRMITEVYRQPDVDVALLGWLTRGQVLSLLMIIAGIVSVVVCGRREVEPIGGLLGPTAGPEGDAPRRAAEGRGEKLDSE